jgi:pantoate--beta-alanine ligase
LLAFRTVEGLEDHLKTLENKGLKTGFVPTMGALHQGHISLLEEAKKHSDVTICSIFVNPRQFNDVSDLTNYPRTLELDVERLVEAGCDILFHPEAEDVFRKQPAVHYDFNGIDGKLEGEHRPGHFEGVASIVKILFDIVKPDHAFFGLKDFQQCLIVEKLVKQSHLDVDLHFCPILREPDGLAMSSRNRRILPEHREAAGMLYQTLVQARNNFSKLSIAELKKEALEHLGHFPEISLDYFEVVDAGSLEPVTDKSAGNLIALLAVKIGPVRLIDNMFLKKQEAAYS